MAITQGLCHNFKKDILLGLHQSNHEYKIALYTFQAVLNPNTLAYTANGEVEGTNYDAGGKILTGLNVVLENSVGILDFADPEWPQSTITARGALIYNNSLPDKNAIAIWDFGKNYKSTNGLFEVRFPLPTSIAALIRIN